MLSFFFAWRVRHNWILQINRPPVISRCSSETRPGRKSRFGANFRLIMCASNGPGPVSLLLILFAQQKLCSKSRESGQGLNARFWPFLRGFRPFWNCSRGSKIISYYHLKALKNPRRMSPVPTFNSKKIDQIPLLYNYFALKKNWVLNILTLPMYTPAYG